MQRARVLEDLGRREESLPCIGDAIATFDELGARWEYADAMAERGIILRELGRLDAAEEDLRTATRISEELGELQLASWTWRALSRVSELRGDHAEAERQARRVARRRGAVRALPVVAARGRRGLRVGAAQAEDSTTVFSSAMRVRIWRLPTSGKMTGAISALGPCMSSKSSRCVTFVASPCGVSSNVLR